MKKAEAIDALRDAVRVRHFSYGTEKSYTVWLRSVCGHTQIETTMRYLTPSAGGVPSPLDALPG